MPRRPLDLSVFKKLYGSNAKLPMPDFAKDATTKDVMAEQPKKATGYGKGAYGSRKKTS